MTIFNYLLQAEFQQSMAMHNSVYPGGVGGSASKYQNRSSSPTFVNYPGHPNTTAEYNLHEAGGEARTGREGFENSSGHQDYHHNQNVNQQQQHQLHPFLHNHQLSLSAAMTSPTSTNAVTNMMKPIRPFKMRSNSSSSHQMVQTNNNNDTSNGGSNSANSNNLIANLKLPVGGSLRHHGGDLIFSEDLDTIEFCMPPAPTENDHRSATMHGSLIHGIQNEMFVPRSQNGLASAAASGTGLHEAFTERRRRSHARRSNHKIEVEQQVKTTLSLYIFC